MPGGILEASIATRADRESGEGISGHLDGRPVDACLEGADSLTWLVERVARGGLYNVERLATETPVYSRRNAPQSSPDCEACRLTPSLAHRPSLHHPPDTLESQ